ncbi:MAG: hypothetical protein ACYTXA_24140 [Nostoc sp.]
MKLTTPRILGVRFNVNAPLPRNSGAGALDTTRDDGLYTRRFGYCVK